ncbi:putative integral membrane protein [Thermococcus prieurii virus 1]|uniref:putative integral membrane protein n=1 Tax=Thermococcus prieurii virus 1 TaxID=1115696 RepID=UPI00024FB212|nr:putative integral membrane protein [Thermococcus prieurii virus 1]AEY69061.1 hypothetical protein [Thermococcus prieurii virus 1]AFA44824.1 putative integral membrane protein [Thermococcus prieurii virus 1]
MVLNIPGLKGSSARGSELHPGPEAQERSRCVLCPAGKTRRRGVFSCFARPEEGAGGWGMSMLRITCRGQHWRNAGVALWILGGIYGSMAVVLHLSTLPAFFMLAIAALLAIRAEKVLEG